MRWTCPKCGKKLDVSNEQLIAGDGVIVCPQCLLQAHQPIPTTRVTARADKTATTSSAPKRTPQRSINFDSETPPEYHPITPPVHKNRMKQASASYHYTGLTGKGATTAQNQPNGKKKSSSKRRKKKKTNADGMSALGCLGRTIVFTLVLFAAYIFFGLLLEAMQ